MIANRLRPAMAAVACLAVLSIQPAIADTVSTGDLGINIVYANNGGTYTWNFDLPSFAALPEPSLFVRYGAWNGSSSDVIDITLNGTLLGSVTNLTGYLSPGPATVTLGAADALHVGANSLVFSLGNGTVHDYVINEATFTYASGVPEPASYALMALGLLCVGLLAKARHR